MRTFALLAIHLIITLLKLLRPGGVKAIIAESLLVKQQLIVLNRPRTKGPNLSTIERFLFGILALIISPKRVMKSAIIIKPATILNFHRWLVSRKYSKLFGNKGRKPGPKSPTKELINAILDIKVENPAFGNKKIADMLKNTFGQYEINKDIVRRILAKHYEPNQSPPGKGPSWLTFLAHAKDSLWYVDMFRCESTLLQSHWVMVVMDVYTRRIIGFSVCLGAMDAEDICSMFYKILPDDYGPNILSSDNDPLFKSLLWKMNLEHWEIGEVKSRPHAPWTHPFIERLIKTVRNEYLDHVLFWNTVDLEAKLARFQNYYNHGRVHHSLGGKVPAQVANEIVIRQAKLDNYDSESYCRGMFKIPVAA